MLEHLGARTEPFPSFFALKFGCASLEHWLLTQNIEATLFMLLVPYLGERAFSKSRCSGALFNKKKYEKYPPNRKES